VFGSTHRVSEFKDSIGTVSATLEHTQRVGAAPKMQAGIKAAYDQAVEDGFKLGHAEGFREGAREFEARHHEALQEFRAALTDFVDRAQTGVDEWYVKAEASLTTLAVEIARRALCSELQGSRESVLLIAQQALAEVRHGTEVRVRVNPLDVSILESRRQEILSAVSGVRNLEIVPDLAVASGCEIDTDGGIVDATIETYLTRLEKEAA